MWGPLVGHTLTGGATGPRAWMGAGSRWTGQRLAGHRAMEAHAAMAGLARWGEGLLMAERPHTFGQWAAGKGSYRGRPGSE